MGEFVRKQGVSRTGCLRTVGSYENKAFPVPDTPGQSVRTETGRFSYRPRDHQPVQLLHFRRKSRMRDHQVASPLHLHRNSWLRDHQPAPLLHFRRKSRLRDHQVASPLHSRRNIRPRDHQPVQLLHFRRKSRLREQNDPPAILDGRFRRVGGAKRAPGLPDG